MVVDHGKAGVTPDSRPVTGLDAGVKANTTLSYGAQYAPLKHDNSRRKALQRTVSCAKRGSKARKKKEVAWAREFRRIAIGRRHAMNRSTTDIIQRHSANLVAESPKIKNMTDGQGWLPQAGVDSGNACAERLRGRQPPCLQG